MDFKKCNCVRLIDDGVSIHGKDWSDGYELLECGVVENIGLFYNDKHKSNNTLHEIFHRIEEIEIFKELKNVECSESLKEVLVCIENDLLHIKLIWEDLNSFYTYKGKYQISWGESNPFERQAVSGD